MHDPTSRAAFAALITALLGGAAAQEQPLFAGELVELPIPSPASVVVTDVNGDGRADVLAGASLHVTLSDPLGRLVPAPTSTGLLMTAFDVGDLDGDGQPDVAGLSAFGQLRVALGDGTGGFSGQAPVVVGGELHDLRLLDANLDGDLDAVVSRPALDEILVLLGDGSADLTPGASVTAGSAPSRLATADLDGDGATDVVASSDDTASVQVLAADGLGGFTSGASLVTASAPLDVVLGDVNADGDPDLAVLVGGDVEVRLGGAGHGFAAPLLWSAGAWVFEGRRLALGDADGDGHTDLLVAVPLGTRSSLLAGDGNGSFAAAVPLACGREAMDVDAGDVDADGRLDVVFVSDQYHELTLLGTTGANLTGVATARQVDVPAANGSLGAADMDADGDMDVVFGHSVSIFDGAAAVVLQNDGSGGLTVHDSEEVLGNHGVSRVRLGDVDSDGDPDVLLASLGAVFPVLIPSAGDGSLQAGAAVTVGLTGNTVLADVDVDGDLDLIGGGWPNTFRTAFNDGTGNFAGVANSAAISGLSFGVFDVGDLDDDGFVDLLYAADDAFGDSIVHVRRGDGSGTFPGPVSDIYGGSFTDTEELRVGDLDGDGDLDAVVQRFLELNTFLNPGDGDLDWRDSEPVDSVTMPLALADVDGDGNLDVLVPHETHHMVSVVRGTGQGRLTEPRRHGSLAGEGVVAIDLDGDDRLDLVTHSNDGYLGVLLNTRLAAWNDRGHELAGSPFNAPWLDGVGSLTPGSWFQFRLRFALHDSSASLVLGITELAAAFKGGVLVPSPDVVIGGVPTGPLGSIDLTSTWPALPAGVEIFVQWWISDPGAPALLAASNGLRATAQ